MVPLLLLLGLSASAQSDLSVRVDALVDSVIDGKDLTPKSWSDRMQLAEVDLNPLLHTDFPSGIAFGATATKLINSSFDDVIKFMQVPGSIFNLVTRVATLRDIHKISEAKDQLQMSLAIKVPVVSDFYAKVVARIYKNEKGRGILLWKQIGDSPDLLYNEGAVICEGADNKTKVTVVGVHILKPIRKVPWVGRATARAFAKTHYGNFITALEAGLKAQSQR